MKTPGEAKKARRAKKAFLPFLPSLLFLLPILVTLSAGSHVAAQTKGGQTKVKLLTEYNSIIVEEVALEKNPTLAKFPAGRDTDLQKKIVADLQKKKVFAEVVDGTRQGGEQGPIATSQAADNPASGKRVILSTTIIDFYPGNKALRYTVGLGAGAAVVKARFVFRDASTGQEIWIHTQEGKFSGFIPIHGAGKDYSVTGASGDIVDRLIRAINKNR